MFERFTSAARQAVVAAQEEARALDHATIGTEHLLLALLAEPSPAAAAVGVEHAAVQARVVELVGEPEGGSPAGHIPFTPRSKKVLELALREAIRLGHGAIGTTHVALGILREGEGLAMQVLTDLGVEVGALRTRLLKAAVEESGPSRRGRGAGRAGKRFGRPLGIARGWSRTGGELEAAEHDVDRHQLVVDALRDPDSAAARALRDKGLDPAELAEAVAAADRAGTSDEPAEERLARSTRIAAEGEELVVRVADPTLAGALADLDVDDLTRRLAAVLAEVDLPAAGGEAESGAA